MHARLSLTQKWPSGKSSHNSSKRQESEWLSTYSQKILPPEMHHANISQIHFSNFACILHPNTFPEKANPFLFCVWTCFQYLDVFPVFGGVPLVFGGVASMNVFWPMCRNCNTFIKKQYKGFGGVPWVFGGVDIISMNVFQRMCCTNTAPLQAAI